MRAVLWPLRGIRTFPQASTSTRPESRASSAFEPARRKKARRQGQQAHPGTLHRSQPSVKLMGPSFLIASRGRVRGSLLGARDGVDISPFAFSSVLSVADVLSVEFIATQWSRNGSGRVLPSILTFALELGGMCSSCDNTILPNLPHHHCMRVLPENNGVLLAQILHAREHRPSNDGPPETDLPDNTSCLTKGCRR